MSKSQHIEQDNPIRVPKPKEEGPVAKTPVEKPPAQDRQDQERVEELGVAPKE